LAVDVVSVMIFTIWMSIKTVKLILLTAKKLIKMVYVLNVMMGIKKLMIPVKLVSKTNLLLAGVHRKSILVIPTTVRRASNITPHMDSATPKTANKYKLILTIVFVLNAILTMS
jgi:hypothetical protein